MMKRFLLFTLFLTLPWIIASQNRDFTVSWDPNGDTDASAVVGDAANLSSRDRAKDAINMEIDEENLSFSKVWIDEGFAAPNSLTISNIRYASVTSEEMARVNRNLVPTSVTGTISSSQARNTIYTSVTIPPIINQNGAFKKVVGFSIAYTYEARNRNQSRLPITNSVLATGNWFKFRIDKTGIYRVDKNFLNDLGMNTDGINPRNLKIYGHGGKPLPLLNSENTEFDLPENAIQVVGEADGSFDNGDFILFYGIGTLGLDDENDTNINPYSDEAYYYVTADGGQGRRVQPMVEPTGAADVLISQFNDYQFHEEDDASPAKVGRRWYGNRFDIENEQSYEFNFPNIVPNQEIRVKARIAGASETSTLMEVSANGANSQTFTFSPIDDINLLVEREYGALFQASGETVTVAFNYNNAGNPASIAYIDYIGIWALRQLTRVDGQLSFRYNDVANMSGVGEYQISNASQFSQVWDITNKGFISAKANDGNGTLSFKASLGELREYVAVDPGDYFTPTQGSQTRVFNQNLKGTIFTDGSGNFQDVDYLIVTAPFLLQPALRLAEYHKNLNGLRVKVITTDRIYEEFSSGKQDIGAIRNFVRYIYENPSSEQNRIKYLCMFGEGSVDYKNRLSNNNNVLPLFHSISSTSTLFGFMSDDFFGMMDPDEGNVDNGGRLDVAVGRILADEVGLANALVDKIIAYGSRESFGNWRTNFVLVSDDVDVEFEFEDLETSLDNLGDEISNEKPFINVKKIHSDAFQQQTSAGGDRYPEVNEAIINSIEVGALVVNYFGHGGEDGLAKEFIFTKTEGAELDNKNRYPMVITVTCEYTKFDNPQRVTAGELNYWNREGGAISMITTTRSIGVTLGVQFNRDFAAEFFGFGTNNFTVPAEALRIAKNGVNNDNKRVIFYIGDPAMEIAFPKRSVRITTLNDQPLLSATDTLQALSRVKLGGEVVDASGNVITNYNGILEAKLFDKKVQRQTLGNDGVRIGGVLAILNFETLGEGLFNGQATITNGTFEFEFVVPRDIQIPVGNGRLSLYASRDDALEDQTGVTTNLLVGGLNENAPEDNQGPLITLFMNDESFVSGGITNDSPILLAKLEDENGINTASGIGHDIIAILDGDESNPIVLNEYYQAEVDDFTRGLANYRLRDLEEGLHTLTLRAWDVYNNSSTADIQFIVAGDNSVEITRVLNYPNPFVNYTEFWFNHNRPFEPLEVQVQVFTVTGKVVWTKNQVVNTDGFLSRDIVWDGKDDFGDRIGKGVYVYKITVKSTLTNQQVEKFEKLVIL